MVRKLRPPPTGGRSARPPGGAVSFTGCRWLPALAIFLLLSSICFSFLQFPLTPLLASDVPCQPTFDGFPDSAPVRGPSGTDDPSDCPDGRGLPATDPSERESLHPLLEQVGPAAPGRGAVTSPERHPVAHSASAFQVLRL